ncbi:VOC family protein [Hyunsoonleella aestuarii]|uniref:VOC domain-containing protein n=1 Tax=Hyunsoonleella aestuarii TaxID=912802 RepID=A0ABP8ECM5_9FLAO|nr:VOC family protein [Hyunsoonleella aestuarii]
MDLNQITIPSLDVAKATEFYKTMGLHLIVDAIPNYVRFQCPSGNSTFSIHHVDAILENSGISIYFENEHLDKLVDELMQKGIVFTELPEDKSWLWREARLKDLDGNTIILYHAGENRLNPPWRIN